MNRKTIIILSAAVLILGAGGLFWLFSGKEPSPETPAAAPGAFPSGEERPSGGAVSRGGLFPGGAAEERVLVQLTPNAVSGASVSSTTVRYVEKSTGHIYEVGLNGEERRRLSNTTVLRTFETLWSPVSDKMIIKYFEDEGLYGAVKIFSAELDPARKSISGVFLPRSVKEVAVSPNRDRIFYLRDSGAGAIATAADYDNGKVNPVYSLPFGDFSVSWVNKNTIALLSRPSAAAAGTLYFLDPFAERLEKIMGGVKGLTALVSPDGKKVIYGRSARNGFETGFFDRAGNEKKKFPLRTLPEKCLWSPLGEETAYCAVPRAPAPALYPDAWYRGEVSFNDSLWKIDILTGETELLLKENGKDIVNILLSPSEDYLVFTDKKDGTLWSVRLGSSQ